MREDGNWETNIVISVTSYTYNKSMAIYKNKKERQIMIMPIQLSMKKIMIKYQF